MAALVTPAELAAVLGMPQPDDPRLDTSCTAADEWLVQYLVPDIDHSTHEADRQAALQVAVEIWQSATAAGGQGVGVDLMPAPYQMGAPLLRKVSGLIAPCRAVQGMVG